MVVAQLGQRLAAAAQQQQRMAQALGAGAAGDAAQHPGAGDAVFAQPPLEIAVAGLQPGAVQPQLAHAAAAVQAQRAGWHAQGQRQADLGRALQHLAGAGRGHFAGQAVVQRLAGRGRLDGFGVGQPGRAGPAAAMPFHQVMPGVDSAVCLQQHAVQRRAIVGQALHAVLAGAVGPASFHRQRVAPPAAGAFQHGAGLAMAVVEAVLTAAAEDRAAPPARTGMGAQHAELAVLGADQGFDRPQRRQALQQFVGSGLQRAHAQRRQALSAQFGLDQVGVGVGQQQLGFAQSQGLGDAALLAAPDLSAGAGAGARVKALAQIGRVALDALSRPGRRSGRKPWKACAEPG